MDNFPVHALIRYIRAHYERDALSIKAIGTKAPFNGGFAFAWLSTKLCARLQRPDLFMNRPAIKFLILRRAS